MLLFVHNYLEIKSCMFLYLRNKPFFTYIWGGPIHCGHHIVQPVSFHQNTKDSMILTGLQSNH